MTTVGTSGLDSGVGLSVYTSGLSAVDEQDKDSVGAGSDKLKVN